ncbi:NAD(P)-binding protein [Polychaeton citri CBS 116435]|uniref:NAD(P)-binding protein n=1 Tax=Polychaeton citri CBS 116435 TaxID=1314669 RepID=A0A9P4QID0_9PEZI|nr:NAD(P)-binding protein [Polychaeton citri CBS 116435]
MARKVFLIIGITGNQGGSVARTFLTHPTLKDQYSLRGLTRNAASVASRKLTAQGVEMVQGNLLDPPSLDEAFSGASVVFSVTDFWALFFDPQNRAHAEQEGKPIGQLAYELEYEQGRNIADAAALLGGTLQRIVVSMLTSPRRFSNGKYQELWHYESKADMITYVEEEHPTLAAKMSRLNMGVFYYSWQIVAAIGPQRQYDGTHVMRSPCKPDTLIPLVEPRQDTGPFVEALLQLPPGVQLYGEARMISWKDYIELWGLLKGKVVRYEQCTIEEYDRLMPEGGLGREIAEMFEWMGDFGYNGNDPDCKMKGELGLEIPGLSSLENYILNEDWSGMGA